MLLHQHIRKTILNSARLNVVYLMINILIERFEYGERIKKLKSNYYFV